MGERGACTCFGVELTPESMPGWPISKKERKDPVPSTNDGWGSREGGRFLCVSVFLSLSSLPLSFFFNSVCQLGVHSKNPVRIRNEDYETGSSGISGVVCVWLCAFMYICMCGSVSVCVCHLFVEQKCPSVSLDRHLAVSHWP